LKLAAGSTGDWLAYFGYWGKRGEKKACPYAAFASPTRSRATGLMKHLQASGYEVEPVHSDDGRFAFDAYRGEKKGRDDVEFFQKIIERASEFRRARPRKRKGS
jgi:hypothetical protein